MADTYEACYNGKPLNPNRGLPTMTYAQAEDCGLTESERLWCRTDGEDTPVTADDIPYDSNNSVKDKIDELESVKSILAIPANTYSTWALAFAQLNTAYQGLSATQKQKAVITRADAIIYRPSNLGGQFSTEYNTSSTIVSVQVFNLTDNKFLNLQFYTGSYQLNDDSANAQSQKLELLVVN